MHHPSATQHIPHKHRRLVHPATHPPSPPTPLPRIALPQGSSLTFYTSYVDYSFVGPALSNMALLEPADVDSLASWPFVSRGPPPLNPDQPWYQPAFANRCVKARVLASTRFTAASIRFTAASTRFTAASPRVCCASACLSCLCMHNAT